MTNFEKWTSYEYNTDSNLNTSKENLEKLKSSIIISSTTEYLRNKLKIDNTFDTGLLKKWNIYKNKNFKGSILIDGNKYNWELWDNFHPFKDWKFDTENWEKELVIAYIQDENNISNLNDYKRNLLEKSINNDFKIKTLKRLKIFWRTIKELQIKLKEKWYVWKIDWKFSKELLKLVFKFQEDNWFEPWIIWVDSFDILFFSEYKEIASKIAEKKGIPKKLFIRLLKKENPYFNPKKWVWWWNTAFGLWQMNDVTWKDYWKWLDKNNAKDQLTASANYLLSLKEYAGDFRIASALYNTWRFFHLVSQWKVLKYLKENGQINKILQENNKLWLVKKNETLAKKAYLIWAISFYWEISYKEASKIINNWTDKFKKDFRFNV